MRHNDNQHKEGEGSLFRASTAAAAAHSLTGKLTHTHTHTQLLIAVLCVVFPPFHFSFAYNNVLPGSQSRSRCRCRGQGIKTRLTAGSDIIRESAFSWRTNNIRCGHVNFPWQFSAARQINELQLQLRQLHFSLPTLSPLPTWLQQHLASFPVCLSSFSHSPRLSMWPVWRQFWGASVGLVLSYFPLLQSSTYSDSNSNWLCH